MARSLSIFGSRAPFLAVALCTLISGCADLTRLNAVPVAEQERATVPDMHGIRYWPDRASTEMVHDALESYRREEALYRTAGHEGALPPASFLAISGGGENGAFGAGLLVGWTAAGTRPAFKAVTGISTGALTAPFAFLGPAYDAQLREVYTTLSAKDVLQPRGYLAAILYDALSDNTPLRKTIARYVNRAMLDAIAAEHAKGRLLLIGTTNLDARQPIIWNVGKLAASGHPKALELLRDIMVASAAIPGAFPPVMIDVQLDGKSYQEMHVDGGATAQVFVYPPSLDISRYAREAGIVRERRLYVLRNARLDPDWAQVERRTLSIAGRAITSLIQTQGAGDLYRIYLAAERDGIDFNLAYIPETFKTPLNEPFETKYMRELFELGYTLAAKGYPWAKAPPGFTVPAVEPPLPPQHDMQPVARGPSQSGSRPSAEPCLGSRRSGFGRAGPPRGRIRSTQPIRCRLGRLRHDQGRSG